MDKSHLNDPKSQRNYPAPYSQSWAGIRHQNKVSADKSMSKSIFRQEPNAGITRRQVLPQRRYIGQDPTVPHLKYGLFHNPKNTYISRAPSRNLNNKSSVRTCRVNESVSAMKESKKGRKINNRIERVYHEDYKSAVDRQLVWKFERGISKTSIQNSIGRVLSPTVSVSRAKQHSSHRLAVCKSTHLDIKPRAYRQLHENQRYF